MRSNARKFIATCALLALGAIVVVAAGCIGDQKKAEPVVVKIKGRVHHVRIKHDKVNFLLDDPATKFVSMNSASSAFWHFKVCESAVDSAAIEFDPAHSPPSPFAGPSRFSFMAMEMGASSGDVIVPSNPADTFHYRLLVYLKGHNKPIEVDPGIIIDDGQPKDSTQNQP